MVRRHKIFSATHSKLTSFRLRTATLGTHVPRRVLYRPNAGGVDFSNVRKKKRASRGYVDNVLSTPTSRTASSRFSQQKSRREFSQTIQRRVRFRRILVAFACILVVLCIAAAAGLFTFFNTLNGKIALQGSDASAALVAPKEDTDAFYTVVSADLDMAGIPNAQEGPDALALVRTDKAAHTAAVVSIPLNLQVIAKDGEVCTLREIKAREGDAAFIRAIADFSGVRIAHFVTIDALGIIELVDKLGGIEVDVSEDVDDPSAGDVYIYAGNQLLDGRAVLTLLRAGNFMDSLETRSNHQRAVLAALSLRLLDENTVGFLSLLDSADSLFHSDVNIHDTLSLVSSLRGIDLSSITGMLVPGYNSARDGTDYYVAQKKAWGSAMGLIDAGQTPVVEKAPTLVDPGGFTLTIRNGGGITGAAAQISETLTNLGFQVESIGNTDVTVYTETLVIYKDKKFEPAAQTVVSSLGMGRTVKNASFYTFDTDVLLILGNDWKPSS